MEMKMEMKMEMEMEKVRITQSYWSEEKERRERRKDLVLDSMLKVTSVVLSDFATPGKYETVQNVRIIFDSICRRNNIPRILTCTNVWKKYVIEYNARNEYITHGKNFRFRAQYFCSKCKKLSKIGCCNEYSPRNRLKRLVVENIHFNPETISKWFTKENRIDYPVDGFAGGIVIA